MKDVVDILQPIVENEIGTTFRTKLSQKITCSSSVVSPGEQKKSVEMSIKKSKKNIEQVMSNENIDVLHFLGSGKSYNQNDTDSIQLLSQKRTRANTLNTRLTRKKQGK